MTCTACGRSWVGQHRCGETVGEAEANARVAAAEESEKTANGACEILAKERKAYRDQCAVLAAENERLRTVIVDAYKRTEHMEALFHGK